MFVCDKCGACCRNIWKTGLLKDFENEKGECIHLAENGLCDIYDDRPEVCSVQKMYELYFKYIMSEKEYLSENYKYCNLLNSRSLQKNTAIK